MAATAVGVATTGSIVAHKREASAAEEELQRYKLDTAKKISEADARTKEAELKLAEVREKLGRPRQLDEKAFSVALEGVPPMPVEITLVSTDPDSHWIASSIWSALERVGWPIIQNGSLEMFRQTPPLLKMCAGNIGGIAVLSKTISKEESEYLAASPRPQRPDAPLLALWDALWKAIGANEAAFATCPFVPDGQLHIVVAPRWVIFPQATAASADPAQPAK